MITGRGRPTLPGAERYTPGATCAAASPRGHGRLPGETEVGYPGALTTSRPLPRAISDRRVHDPEHGPSRGSVLPGVLGEGKARSQAWDPVFPSSPARHARPLATVTLRGAKPVGRLRLHLRRQCVLEPCAQQSRSLSSRRYLVQVLNPRGGARGAELEGRSPRDSQLGSHGRSANRNARMRTRAGRSRSFGRANQLPRSSSCALGNLGRNRFV